MGWTSVCCFWVLFVFQLWVYGCSGCSDEEKSALLELKSSMNHPNEVGINCCKWDGVTCNSRTRRVVKLGLSSYTRLSKGVSGDWYLNASLLLPFTELQSLELRENSMRGLIDGEGLCKFKDLQRLDLSHNYFDGPLPINAVENLTSLKTIGLAGNWFNDSQSIQEKVDVFFSIPLEFCKLKDLQRLDLSHNNFEGPIPSCFSNLTSLQLLNLSNNGFSGMIPTSTTGNDESKGPLPIKGFCKLKDIKWLDLSFNHFEGSIPSCLSDFSNLQLLDLSNNGFSGKIPASTFSNVTSLSYLSLAKNNFSGIVEFRSFAHLSKLKEFVLSDNDLEVETEYPRLNFTFQLTALGLSNCKLSTLAVAFLTSCIVNLDNNDFVGTIPPSLFNVSWLWGLDVGDNHLSGRIPSQIGDNLVLSTLILRGNHFDGLVPFEICKLRYLQFLDLSDNSLSGPIPSCSNFTYLKFMHLENNSFSGFIPRALSSSSSLMSLNIRHNYIDGVIPVWIDRLSRLRILLMKGNNLYGHIPNELCQLKNLNLLDLSYNNLFGSLPSCLNNLTFGRTIFFDDFGVSGDSSSYFSSPSNVYTFGTIFDEATEELKEVEFVTKRMENSYKGGVLNYMSGIDVSCNQLTGEIPHEMGQLSGLHSMNLSYNQFAGLIPATFKKLSQIESLDLSHNKLNGTIPSELTELYSLSVFSVAYNNLSGRTPDMKSQFSAFSESSYEGNPLLCGPPLSRSCISTAPIGEVPEEDDDSIVSFYGSFVGSYLVFLIGTVGVLYFTSQWRAMCFLYIVDSWCAFRLYKLCRLCNCK
ncbi:putative LRR receptor-like serine/threonine-protein kinase [Cinnamomum micranthum f. kanehirae]|uniref:Putative LRR receptor-like serine/threonine-protein kinase n=1 Tax=Cinnamomum micranthum f. kanehirae TaxID=337451 RepID=A0A443NAN5_9MAGN|nr:putative LRR receptor-like serine/threonine-protein kinase [Cinnamomum micranthum f. kanehirae]